MLISLLDFMLVLIHAFLPIVLILGGVLLVHVHLLSHFLNVLEHNFHIGFLPASFLLVQFFRDQGSVSLPSV